MSSQKTVFVTVGTTQFEDLIRVMDSPETLAVVKARGFDSVTFQIGKGEYVPKSCSDDSIAPCLDCTYFRTKPTLSNDLASASLVVSHAGAGTIFETLSLRKPLVVVTNDKLMHGHQDEIADKLEAGKHLIATTPSGVTDVLATKNLDNFTPLPPSDPTAFAHKLDDLCGFA